MLPGKSSSRHDEQVTYPRAYIAQDWAELEWDGEGDPPKPFDGTGPLPRFGPAWGYIDDGVRAVEEGEWLTADEAIAWARQRAQVVLVRVGYSDYHSAGEHHVPGVPAWPPTEHAIRHETRRPR